MGLVTATVSEVFVESDILCKNEFWCFAPLCAGLLWKVCFVQSAALFAFLVQYTCLPDCSVALYRCLMASVSSNRVLHPEHILHHNSFLCISICEVITYWGWCAIESHSLQCNMFNVYRTREVRFTCARSYWGYVFVCLFVCLLLEPDCHMLCRLRSVLSAESVQKCLPLLTDWTHQINSSNLC